MPNIPTSNPNVVGIDAIITGIRDDIDAVEAVNATQATTLTSHTSSLSSLGTRVTTAEADIDALQAAVGNDVDDRLTTLENEIGLIQEDIGNDGNIDNRLTDLESNVAEAQGNIVTVQDAISDFEPILSTAVTDIDAVEAVNSSQATAITAIQAVNTSQSSSITSIQSAATALTTRVTTAEGDIDDLETAVADLVNAAVITFDGVVNDEDVDNTTRFLELVALGKPILFGPGAWRFKTPLVISSLDDPHFFDKLILLGQGYENTAQHLEEGASLVPGGKNTATIEIELPSDDDFWLRWDDTEYRIGPWQFSNLTFNFIQGSPGNFISLGDIDTTEIGPPTIRGFYAEHCYFTHYDLHYTDYLIDEANGYVINPDYKSIGIRIAIGYDIDINSCSFRGWHTPIEFINCDSPAADNLHFQFCGRMEAYCNEGTTSVSVAGRYSRLFNEAPMLGGFVFTDGAMLQSLSVEHFANTINNVFAMPTTITWSYAIGTDYITVGNFPGSYDATDYIPPRTCILIDPITQDTGPPVSTDIPSIPLFITKVEATKLYFRNSLSSSHLRKILAGTGVGFYRYFHSLITLSGNSTSLQQYDIRFTGAPNNLPCICICPQSRPITVTDGTAFLTSDTNRALIVMSSGGDQASMGAGVNWMGSRDKPDHPFCYQGGLQPYYDVNTLLPTTDEYTGKQFACPGKGGYYSNNNHRELFIRYQSDTSLSSSKPVPVFKPTDSSLQWWLIPGLRRTTTTVSVTVRAYASASTTASIYGGAGSTATQAFGSAGWLTFTKTLTATTQMLGSTVWITGPNLYVAWVILDQGF